MNIFKKKQEAQQELYGEPSESAIGEGTVVDEGTQAYLLEQHLAEERKEDPAAWATEQLESYQLTPGARSLLDRALDNVSRSNGANLVDENAKLDIKLRADLISACGNDLNIALVALSESTDPLDTPSAVQSMLYNVLKAAVFIGNLDYRNFLDPARDMDLHLYIGAAPKDTGETGREPGSPQFYTDNREDRSPLEGQSGFETGAEFQLSKLRELYGSDVDVEGDVVAASLRDLRYHFQLIAESFGWDSERPMAFGNVQEKDGTFTPITDAVQAMDIAEIRRQAARAAKRVKQTETMSKAAERARALLLSRVGK